MQEYSKTIEISAPAAFVWPYLTESDRIQQVANFDSIEQVPEGPVEKGTRWYQTMRMLGKKFESSDEIIEFEPSKRLVFRSVESPFPYTIEYVVDGEGGTTWVTCNAEMGDSKGFFGRFAEPVVTRLMEHEFRGQLERLKALVEADNG